MLGALGARLGFGRRKTDREIPRTTLKLALLAEHCHWTLDGASEAQVMRIHGRWQATNITREPILALSAKLLRPHLRSLQPQSIVLTRATSEVAFAQRAIAPGDMSEVTVELTVLQPFAQAGRPIAVELAVLDQYENEHRTGKLVLPYRAATQAATE